MTENSHEIIDIIGKNFVKAQNEYDYQVLIRKDPHLIDCMLTIGTVDLTFKYTPRAQSALSQFLATDLAEKYQIIEGIAALEPLAGTYEFSMSPDNIYTDIHWNIAILKRDVNRREETNFLRMYKALAACLLLGEDVYETCLYGGDEVLKAHVETSPLCELRTAEEVKEHYLDLYRELRAERQNRFTFIETAKLKRLVITRLAAAVLAGALLVGGAFYAFHEVSYAKASIAGYERYLSKDYLGCINGMQTIGTDRMTSVQTQILATSYVSAEALNAEQRTRILASLSHTAPERNIYWICIGRKQFAEAVDMAVRLNDEELQLYAYMKQRDELEMNTTMSGEDKEKALQDVQRRIDALAKSLGLDSREEFTPYAKEADVE